MTAVTIHASGVDMSDVAKELFDLATDTELAHVRSSGTGMTVPDTLAYRWLAGRLNGHAPTAMPQQAAPPTVTSAVREAETEHGLTDPRPPSSASAGTDSTPRLTGGRAPRRRTAPTEETT